MKLRASQTTGNYEQRYFAMLKVGEMYERWHQDFPEAINWYSQAMDVDPPRLDAYFYAGQRYRLSGDFENGLPFLMKGVKLPMPERSLFQWHQMYECLIHIELGRLVSSMASMNHESLTLRVLKRTRKSLRAAKKGCDQSSMAEVDGLKSVVEAKILELKSLSKGKTKYEQLRSVVADFLDFATDNMQALEEYLDKQSSHAIAISDKLGNLFGKCTSHHHVISFCVFVLFLCSNCSFDVDLGYMRLHLLLLDLFIQLVCKTTLTLVFRPAVHTALPQHHI